MKFSLALLLSTSSLSQSLVSAFQPNSILFRQRANDAQCRNQANFLSLGSSEYLDRLTTLAQQEEQGELSDRDEYARWCRTYGKQEDDTRYEIFLSNFQSMKEYSKKTGKPMKMTSYADLTAEEYIKAVAEDQEERERMKIEAYKAKKAKELAEQQEAYEKMKMETEAFKAKKEKERADAAAAAEKERKERELERQKAETQKKKDIELAAIAAAKVEQERQAAMIAKIRALEQESKRIELEKAKKAIGALWKLSKEEEPRKVIKKKSLLSSLLSPFLKKPVKSQEAKAIQKPPEPKIPSSPKTKPVPDKVGIPFTFSFGSDKKAASSGQKKVTNAPQKKVTAEVNRPFSFNFGFSKAKPASTKVDLLVPTPFSFQFGPSKVKSVSVAPKKVAPAIGRPLSFSFGSSDAKSISVAPKKVAPTKVAPAKARPFSLSFGSSEAKSTSVAPKRVTAAVRIKAKPSASKPISVATINFQSKAKTPILRGFKLNADGTISGTVRNSSRYRDGTFITTSPIQIHTKGIKLKAGMTVKTKSGTSYKLE